MRPSLQAVIGALVGGGLVGAAWYADPASSRPKALDCAGTLTNLVGRPFSAPLKDIMVVIDRSRNEIARGSQRFAITEITGGKILYRQVSGDITVAGAIDRFTGAVEETNAKGPIVRSRTNLTCRPVNRLF